jgi:phospho-N-acetylmuramoyl-pentapeptide-transferase
MLALGLLAKTQVGLPVATLILASFVGFLDDFLQVAEGRISKLGKHFAGGLEFKYRFTFIALLGFFVGWFFLAFLGQDTMHIPWIGDVDLGWWFPFFFAVVMLATYSGGIIDGIDGLAGGSFALMFSAFGAIAFFEGNVQLAAFCAAVVGSLLSFLWFNIPPAKFYMTEVGVMGLTATLSVVAMLTNSIFLIPVIGILLVVESGSVIVQLLSKKLRKGKKILLAAPIHHHLEALGWEKPQITMRFWLVGFVAAFAGIAIHFLG